MIIYCTTLHCVPFPPISHVQTISQAPNICALCCCNHHIIKISVALQFAIPSRTNAAPTHRMYSVTFSWNTPHTRPNSPIYDNLPSLCLLLQGWGQTPFIDSFQSLGVGCGSLSSLELYCVYIYINIYINMCGTALLPRAHFPTTCNTEFDAAIQTRGAIQL